MMKRTALLVFLGALPENVAVATAASSSSSFQAAANPIRKVVTMLQDMQAKVTEEGKKEEDLYDKFMCYCSTNGGSLSASIETAEAKLEAVSADLKAAQERKTQTEGALAENQASKKEAEDTMAKAEELRAKESAEFAKEKSESETNIAAIKKAVAALEKGMAGSFLQTTEAATLRNIVVDRANIPDATREELVSFLSGTDKGEYVPQSGEVTGILKTIGDEMSKSLEEAEATEKAAIANFEALMAAKKKEVASLQQQIEEQMQRIGELGVQLAENGNDIEDTQEALAADEQFKKELETSCSTKTAEWEEIKKTRAEELVALAETIKVLNDDDALELFKSTLPSTSSSLMQLTVSTREQRTRALAALRAGASKRPELDLIALALRGKSTGFEKVISMIDGMVSNLKAEQVQDEQKKEYCDTELDSAEDKHKQLELAFSDAEKAIDELESQISSLAEEIKSLTAGIKALDKSVAEATEQRKQENEEFKALTAADSTAKEVLEWAKNRLYKFYSPKLYKAPPKRELTEEEQIVVNMGGTPPPTEAPGGIAGTGIGAFVQIRAHRAVSREAPPPPPETFGAYTKKAEESNGVIAMMDLLIADLTKEMQEAGVSEKDAQADYEKLMSDAAEKRAADSKSLAEREGAKADAEETLESVKDEHANLAQEIMGNSKYIADLHAECDWLLKYFEARKEARTSEIESLKNAKAVLSGSDYSLMQVKRRRAAFLSK